MITGAGHIGFSDYADVVADVMAERWLIPLLDDSMLRIIVGLMDYASRDSAGAMRCCHITGHKWRMSGRKFFRLQAQQTGTVEFNETYVNTLYLQLGGGNPRLALHLRCVDRNHRHLGVETISNQVPTARQQAALVGSAVVLPPSLTIELGWLSLKFKADRAIVAVLGAGGRIELLARGQDGAVWHISEQPLPDWGGTWQSLGGVIQPLLAGIANSDGRVEIFAKGMDNAVCHNWQTTPGGAWSGWTTLGGAVDDLLVAASESGGRLVVFARRRDGSLWHIKQTSALDWGKQWLQLEGTIQDALAVGSNADRRLEIFAKGMDGEL
jgi:hypothetical protein